MSEIRATLTLEQDGTSLPDMPTIRRLILAETSGLINLSYAPDNNSSTFHPVVQASMPTLSVLYIASDQAINVQLNGSATAIPIQAGGELLLVGTQLSQGTPSNNVEINNPALTGGATANVTMFLAGS
jgi:hypothetical protein